MNPKISRESSSQEKSSEKQPFSKDLLISDVARWYPEVIEVFMDYGLYCVGCVVSGFETVEEGAMGHGIVDDDFENLILDADEKIKEKAFKSNKCQM